MIKYTFLYRLNLRGKVDILRFETIEQNLKTAVSQWKRYKESQTRVRDLIIFIKIIKTPVVN